MDHKPGETSQQASNLLPTQQQQQQHGRLMGSAQQHHYGQHQQRLERHLEERARSGCSHASTSTTTDLQQQQQQAPYAQSYLDHRLTVQQAPAPLKKKRGPKAGKKAALAKAELAIQRAAWMLTSNDMPSMEANQTQSGRPPNDPYAFQSDSAATFGAVELAQQQRPRQMRPTNRHSEQKPRSNLRLDANDFLHHAEINTYNKQSQNNNNNDSDNNLNTRQPSTQGLSAAATTNYQQMMIAHQPAQQQQQQQQQQQFQIDGQHQLAARQAPPPVMQQPAESAYYPQQQQQQPAPQLGYANEEAQYHAQHYHHHEQGQFQPQPQPQPQHQHQPQPQQRAHPARQYQADGFAPNQHQHHHRASPQQQVPPPQAPYPAPPIDEPGAAYVAAAPAPRQQLTEQRRRLSPGYQQQQQPAPVRHQHQPAGRMMPVEAQQQQQYHHNYQQQPAAGKQHLKPRELIPGQYQAQPQKPTDAPYADEQQAQPQPQYQSGGSPTLLQQQLNRPGSQQPQRIFSQRAVGQPQPPQPAPAPPNGYMQQQPVRRAPPPMARFDDHLINSDLGCGPPNEGPQQQAQQVYNFQPQPQRGQPQPQPQPQPAPIIHRQRPLEHPPHLLVGNPTPPLTPTSHCAPAQLQQQANRVQPAPPGQPISDQWMPPHQQHVPSAARPPAHHTVHAHQQQQQQRPLMMPKHQAGAFQSNGQPTQHYHASQAQQQGLTQVVQHYPPGQQPRPVMMMSPAPDHQHPHLHPHPQQHPQQHLQQQVVARLTLPLRDTPPLLGPFKLSHDAQVTSKVFHLKPQLFDSLSKSAMMNPNQAAVIQELQFRAYLLLNNSNSSCKQPAGEHQHYHSSASLLARSPPSGSATTKSSCNWPELFQLSVNGQIVHLDRSKHHQQQQQHRAVDIFQYCQPGDNIMELQVSDCYCSHEFVLEAVDRPTLKAFMNSCFKSRLLSYENCLQKLRYNYGSSGFLMSSSQQPGSSSTTVIINEYISVGEFTQQQQQQGIEQTKVRISMRCPLSPSGGRMRTPARGHNCKHLQCFDLETFLMINRDRSQWCCPICFLSIPFNMLELDQHQMSILRSLADLQPATDDVLVDSAGQWQAYYGPPPSMTHQHQHQHQHHQIPQQLQTAKSTGIYHPSQAQSNHQHILSPTNQPPARPGSGPNMASGQRAPPGRLNSPNTWQPDNSSNNKPKQQHIEPAGPVRRPASANLAQQQHQMCDRGLPADLPPAKRVCAGPPAQQPFLSINSKPIDQPARQQQQQQYFNNPDGATNTPQRSPFVGPPASIPAGPTDTSDDLSPLAAMERTIIQHEMGPPPFDPNSLSSSLAPVSNQATQPAAAANKGPPAASGAATGSSGVQLQQQQASPQNQHIAAAVVPPPPTNEAMIASSPSGRANSLASASPQHQNTPSRLSIGPDSPMQYAAAQLSNQTTTTSISHPATPVSSSSMLVHCGPETPATPSNSGSQPIQQQQQQQPAGLAGGAGVVDHQPLSNGSASAGSVTSSSTMTPSGQSLGSVGMGGDSRCGTAPLQVNGSLGLDDLMIAGGSQSARNVAADGQPFKVAQMSAGSLEEKNEILMGKLMMESGESLLHRSGAGHHDGGELALALDEAEWRQQLDRGKSEHLANFLNEPMMNKQHSNAHNIHHNHHQQNQHQHQHPGANKMLSGGLNPSDDEQSEGSATSPPNQQHNPDQINDFNNYLDCGDVVDNGTGLPPDDSILDLFER